jgi:hypothetical protein
LFGISCVFYINALWGYFRFVAEPTFLFCFFYF